MTPELFTNIEQAEGVELTAYPDPDSALGEACTKANLRLVDWIKLPGGDKLDGSPWTIGYGHTGPEVHPGLTWTTSQAEAALHVDVAKAVAELDAKLAWWRKLNDVRQDAMAELCFNMGIGYPAVGKTSGHGLRSFVQTLKAIQGGSYTVAAEGLLASGWAKSVGPTRSGRIAAMVRTGAQAAP